MFASSESVVNDVFSYFPDYLRVLVNLGRAHPERK